MAAELLAAIAAAEREQRREHDRLERVREVRAKLKRLADLAAEAVSEDPKLATILGEVLAIRAKEPRANVLVYSEYAASQRALVAALEAARTRCEIEGEVLALSGEDGDGVRATATQRFRTEEPLVLVSTDATAEGLNLHTRCHHLIHLELPYNPNRLEQRNGRIDRFGQREGPIVRYLYLAGTFEERLLMRLIAK